MPRTAQALAANERGLKSLARIGSERIDISRQRPVFACRRCPIVSEIVELHADGQVVLAHILEARVAPSSSQLPRSRQRMGAIAGAVLLRGRIERCCGVEENADADEFAATVPKWWPQPSRRSARPGASRLWPCSARGT